MVISGIQIRTAQIAAGIPAGILSELSDVQYLAPRSDWLCGDYHRWFLNHFLAAFGIREYETESGDCDDFVDLFCAGARIAHRRTPEGKGFALPLGRLNFLRVPGAPPGPLQQKHALAWAYTSDKGLIFPEPQVLYRIEHLTVPQLNSTSRCSD